MGKGKDRAIVGLDIGTYAMKCVEVASEGDKIRLVRASILPSSDSAEQLIKAIDILLDKSQLSLKKVRISISGGSSLLIRRIQLPKMTPSELKGAIRFEAESHIPFPVDDCHLDFQILGESPDKKNMTVLLVAAKKDFIQERLKPLITLGVRPEVIDVDIFCLINAFGMLGPDQNEPTFALLNIGHQVSSFAIIQDKLPYFVREIPFGSKGVTQAIQTIKGVAEPDADAMKIHRPAEAGLDFKRLIHEGFEPVMDEIRHSIDFFENETGEEIKNIWLSGGGALCPRTAEILSEELGQVFKLWDNTQKMEIFGSVDHGFLAEHSAELNVALGMALRGVRR